MPRPRKPEAAAKAILDMIAKKEATNAADAVKKRPELEPGLAFLKVAVQDAKPGSDTSAPSAAKKPIPAATGSGPQRFTR